MEVTGAKAPEHSRRCATSPPAGISARYLTPSLRTQPALPPLNRCHPEKGPDGNEGIPPSGSPTSSGG